MAKPYWEKEVSPQTVTAKDGRHGSGDPCVGHVRGTEEDLVKKPFEGKQRRLWIAWEG